MSKLSELIDQALKEDTTVYASVSFGNIYNLVSQKIKLDTNVDCKGADVQITAYDVSHIIKGHGVEAEKQAARGQIGVTSDDFELIKQIIFEYDTVEKGNIVRRSQSLKFTKRITQIEYHVTVSVDGHPPNRKMVVKTMYKRH